MKTRTTCSTCWAVEDQEPIQTLREDRPHEPLRHAVWVRATPSCVHRNPSKTNQSACASRIRWLFEDHPPTANKHAGEREDCGDQSHERPYRFCERAEPAEV